MKTVFETLVGFVVIATSPVWFLAIIILFTLGDIYETAQETGEKVIKSFFESWRCP